MDEMVDAMEDADDSVIVSDESVAAAAAANSMIKTLDERKRFLKKRLPNYEIILGCKVNLRLSISETRKNSKLSYTHELLFVDPDAIDEVLGTLTTDMLYDLIDPDTVDLYATAAVVGANKDSPRDADAERKRVEALYDDEDNALTFFAPDVVCHSFFVRDP